MKIVISSGHGLYIRGASGYLDEVDCAREVVDRVAELWQEAGVDVDVFHDNTSTSQNENLNAIVNYHNSRSRDYDVSIHFNAYSTTSKPMGHECLYVTQQGLATDIAAGVAGAGSFINRGAKYRSDLYFLNNTEQPAVLLEVCFVDSQADADLYRRNFEAVCVAIAEIIGDVEIGEAPDQPPPDIEIPPPDQPEIARVDITSVTTGNVIISLNGQEFVHGDVRCLDRVYVTLRVEGEVAVTINGQDYHNVESERPPQIPENQRNIICTVFGGKDDPNNSAYDEHFITDSERGCALPFKFQGTRPEVRVFNTANELSVICEIVDVGPWHTDDDYWEGDDRPRAEPPGSTIQGGPNDGETSNGAGIDLTPGAASAIGLDGKGKVHWEFVEDEDD